MVFRGTYSKKNSDYNAKYREQIGFENNQIRIHLGMRLFILIEGIFETLIG